MKSNLLKLDPLSLFSHELKTPLSSFQLGLSLLEKDFEKNKDILPLLKAELTFLNEFIYNILDLRWIEKKEKPLTFKWVSFDSLLESAYSGLKIIAEKKGISLKFKKPEEIEVFADPLWISCVLKNLLSNAVYFSFEKESIEVEIQYHKSSSQFSCSIQNRSPLKIEEEKLFDLFYTKSLDSKKKGTGLGLNLVQSIIKAHKGSIQVQNKGQEVLFLFVLPKARLIEKAA